MLKDQNFLQPPGPAELAGLASRAFKTDFLDFIFGQPYDPVQLIEDYFRSLAAGGAAPPRCLLFKIQPASVPEPAGLVWFENINWIHRNLVMTIYLLPEFRVRGLGARALYHAAYYAFKILNLRKIKSFVYDSNPAMLHILRELGARCEGRHRDFRIFQGRYQAAWLFSMDSDVFFNSPKIKLGTRRWEQAI